MPHDTNPGDEMWVLTAFFAIIGLAFTLFPQVTLFLFNLLSDRTEVQVPASSLRWMGLLFLLTAAIFLVLILTKTLN